MKKIEQIIRYTSQCEFPEDDWQLVLNYCRNNFKGGKIHRALKPKYKSTYKQFIEWIDNGFGSGDIVRYGHTVGIVSLVAPTTIILAAYCDFDGNLVAQDLEVFPGKVLPLEDKPKKEFEELLFKNGYDFSIRIGKLVELYSPKKYSYVSFSYHDSPYINIGMFLESSENEYHFVALLMDGELYFDHKVEKKCTPLKQATMKEIQTLHGRASKEGWMFNGRKNVFIQKNGRNLREKYWYITDRFSVTADIDMGGQKHDERFEVGNYFIDETEAILFAKEIIERRKEG